MRAHFPLTSAMFWVSRSNVKMPACEFSKMPRYFRSSARSPTANDEVTTPMVTKITNHAVEIATSMGSKLLKK